MSLSQIINIIGLIVDITGVVLLFFYGLPPDLNKNGEVYKILEQVDESDKIKWKRYKNYSRVALILLLLGFTLQVISIFLTSNNDCLS